MREVAAHYEHFGGVSPINGQNRALLAALRAELAAHGPDLPVYWGNRNWHPYLADTLREMEGDGVGSALAFVTSAYGSYSGCRQYLEDIVRARDEVGEGAPEIHKLRLYYNHPGFIEANVAQVAAAFERVPSQARAGGRSRIHRAQHPPGHGQRRRIRGGASRGRGSRGQRRGPVGWTFAYQSRSGPPQQPWLEPDIGDHLKALAAAGVKDVVVGPIGFVSDHMEVIYDLDTEAQEKAQALGIRLVRAATPGTHPAFVRMIRRAGRGADDRGQLSHDGRGPGAESRRLSLGLLPGAGPAETLSRLMLGTP